MLLSHVMETTPDKDEASQHSSIFTNNLSEPVVNSTRSIPPTTTNVATKKQLEGQALSGDHGTIAGQCVPSRLAALRKQNAEHLLEVVRKAERQEAERRRKLRHATSKTNLEYLQKRFDTERRQDQNQIAGLVQDAQAVESVLRSSLAQEIHAQQVQQRRTSGNATSGTGGTPVGRVGCDDNSCEGNAMSAAGGGEEEGGAAGESVASTGGRRSTGSNAYVEAEAKEDPEFISTGKMRFMKYVYKRVDDQKLERANARLTAQVAGTNRSERRPRGRGGGACSAPTHAGINDGPDTTNRGTTRDRATSLSSACCTKNGREKLLTEKRGILLELKGLVCRQAEALDCLMEGCSNPKTIANNRNPNGFLSSCANNRGRNNGSYCESDVGHRFGRVVRRPRPISETNLVCRSFSEGDCSGNNYSIGRYQRRNSAFTNSTSFSSFSAASTTTSGTTFPQNRISSQPPSMRSPPPPEQDAISAFLARGGRWEVGQGKQGRIEARQKSVASSASYATYGEKGAGRVGAIGSGRSYNRPRGIPALPIRRGVI